MSLPIEGGGPPRSLAELPPNWGSVHPVLGPTYEAAYPEIAPVVHDLKLPAQHSRIAVETKAGLAQAYMSQLFPDIPLFLLSDAGKTAIVLHDGDENGAHVYKVFRWQPPVYAAVESEMAAQMV